jgi:flagellar basal body rod protein FlgB
VVPSLFGAGTLTNDLRGALDELSATHHTIADDVANATSRSASTGFAGQLQSSMTKTDENLTRDMASLADTETRYEAAAKLLQKSYADLRAAITGNG